MSVCSGSDSHVVFLSHKRGLEDRLHPLTKSKPPLASGLLTPREAETMRFASEIEKQTENEPCAGICDSESSAQFLTDSHLHD